ncbi:MAG: tetraacyldisaccharide 4'-kinase, partial [Prevotella sp.]|nr:tetraacyldisaccharide 4'-kinase [Prevotella sp.]
LQPLNGFSLDLQKSAYTLPIKVRIMLDQEDEFNKIILDYVFKDATNISDAPQPDQKKNEEKQQENSATTTTTISFQD